MRSRVTAKPLDIRASIEINLAEGEGFEPPEALPPQRFSSSRTDVRRRPPTFTLITNRNSWVRQWLPLFGWVRSGCRHGCRHGGAVPGRLEGFGRWRRRGGDLRVRQGGDWACS